VKNPKQQGNTDVFSGNGEKPENDDKVSELITTSILDMENTYHIHMTVDTYTSLFHHLDSIMINIIIIFISPYMVE